MDDGQRSMTQFEELDAPVAEVVPVRGRVARLGGSRPAPILVSDGGRGDSTPAMIRTPWPMATAVVACILALALGDDGPWIFVVPGLTALGGAWLDRRIPFSFAEGFIGYGGDPEPVHGVPEDDWPPAGRRGVPAAT